nr:MAG TPA: hypothetical protein [Bacteriophage sp.]
MKQNFVLIFRNIRKNFDAPMGWFLDWKNHFENVTRFMCNICKIATRK